MNTPPLLKGAIPRLLSRLAVLLLLLQTHPQAYAQVTKVNRNLQIAIDILLGACILIFTAFVIKAGVEIANHNRKLVEVWPILAGAAIAGSGALIAGLLL